ncbi:MAG: TrbI/VirB10 family protein, partial [Gammaproteobacteria bacterium]
AGKGMGMPPLYKAGDIIFGIMETSVDSDEPGPVLAKVVSGPLAGAKLIGSFKRVEAQVFIEFTVLSAPDMDQSLPVKAVAIDPETARTAISTNVDYHRLLRYSTLFASSFLQGVGEAVLAGIQPEFAVTGETITITDVAVSTKDQVLVGLGEVGTKLGEKLDPLFDMPPTVTVDSGTSIGLLFLQDFYLQPPTGGVSATPTPAPAPAVQVIRQDVNGNPIPASNASVTNASTVNTK